MFTIYWTNFHYFNQSRFDTVEAAVAYGKGRCFSFSVHDEAKTLIAAWDYFGGLRYYDDAPAHRDDGSLAEFDRHIAGDR